MSNRRNLPVRMSPRPVAAFLRRVRASQAYADLYNDRYFIAACVLILVCAFLIPLLTRGMYLTWNGWDQIPGLSDTPPTLPATPTVGNCGDYCGSDAGLLPPDAGR